MTEMRKRTYEEQEILIEALSITLSKEPRTKEDLIILAQAAFNEMERVNDFFGNLVKDLEEEKVKERRKNIKLVR